MHGLLKRTVLGFFGHVTRQVSGWHEGEAVARCAIKQDATKQKITHW
jgi:hypothetical protein